MRPTLTDDALVRQLRERTDATLPPMELRADAVLAAGRRYCRRRAAAQVSAGGVVAAAVVVGLQLTALDGRPVTQPATGLTEPPSPRATEAPGPAVLDRYLCNDTPVALDVLGAGRPATDLDPAQLTTLESMDLNAGPDWASWTVLEESASAIVLIRPTPAEGKAYELYGIELVPPGGGALPVNDTSDPAWSVSRWSSCDVRADLDGLNNVSLGLEREHSIEPDARQVTVLVHEDACTGGADPTARIEIVSVEYTPTSVEVLVGTRPLDGGLAVTCPGNPTVPFMIELREPIGDRSLVDASTYPKSELSSRSP